MKILFTDGSASPNPGPGGFAVLEKIGEELRPVVLGREKDTTNIRMEASAIISAIEYAGEEGCEIHTDSEFWINVLEKWADNWAKCGWKKSKGEIKNLDLVQKLHHLYHKYHVQLIWVHGHAGHIENELTDFWANRARKGQTSISA